MVSRAPWCHDVLRDLLVAPAGPLRRLDVVAATGSTNEDVLNAVRDDPAAWPTGSLLLADHQDAGRGRCGRAWQSPPGASLLGTFVVRPGPSAGGRGWLPLLAGLSVVRALRATGARAWLKWPNDVLVAPPGAPDLDGWGSLRKVAGVLAQATADGAVIAIGVGVNVTQRSAELPVPWASSLALVGAGTDREALLVALVAELTEVVGRWQQAAGDAAGEGLAAEVAAVCATLGRPVRVERPGGEVLTGQAVRLDDDGALVVTVDAAEHRVLAGDVVHLRSG
ncbi:MAG: biotin--[acetyl-CoA-carboxylase] ligase [Micrococcales bacterium]|nr:biotin--[acetyl-CoA-carboxylase] ligase [Micrococcales bacterium]